MALPVIDFSKCGLLQQDSDVTYEALQTTGEELFTAFTTAGFAHLSNTGIPRYLVDDMNEVADNFFELPLDYKMKFVSTKDMVNEMNYDAIGTLKANPERQQFDLVELFRIPCFSIDAWPEVNNMKEKAEHFQKVCQNLAMRIFKALGIGMKLKDVDIFCKCHSMIGTKKNTSSLVFTRYPGITKDIEIAEAQLRMGEHCDVTSLSMLFQDDIGGLQIKNAEGKFIDAPIIPGTVLLNIGDILQAWSGGRLKSTEHRVVIPEDAVKRSSVRRLVGLFILSDDEVELKELEYEDSDEIPQQTGEFLSAKGFKIKRYNELYPKNEGLPKYSQ